MGIYSGGLIIGRIFASEIREGLFLGGLFMAGGGGGGAHYRNFTVVHLTNTRFPLKLNTPAVHHGSGMKWVYKRVLFRNSFY